ncbi:gluconokinase [Mariniblastus fucicola]|uniref:Gluconokinase n=1 Tax=Mariniblastus fucicola TaxID=980251 RepID=A0A5B9P1W7_9BACT|nr:gluconokinase [Mariniblastus fucicola]QEG20308.1 Thermoresistant gluconokinase [Mariniblastus fucicola]
MRSQTPQLIVIMGVCGCGKSSVGEALSLRTGISYHDGDDFHSDANRNKMSQGIPLTDEDRQPWLESIVAFAQQQCEQGRSLVVACSALKKAYRDTLRTLDAPVKFVHLTGSKATIASRLADRKGHYMPETMLQSQLDTIESPTGENGAVEVSIEQTVDQIVSQAMELLDLTTEG